MKKENIQSRNRKLSAKARKKHSSFPSSASDMLKPLYGYGSYYMPPPHAAAAAAARLLGGLLYGVSAFDPLTFAVVPLVLGGVALAAAWLPAYRASTIDPVTALHAD